MSNSQVGYCGTKPSDTPPGWTFFARQAPITFCIPGLLPSYFSPILMYKARLPKIKYKPTSPHQLFCFQKCSWDPSLLLTVSALVAALRGNLWQKAAICILQQLNTQPNVQLAVVINRSGLCFWKKKKKKTCHDQTALLSRGVIEKVRHAFISLWLDSLCPSPFSLFGGKYYWQAPNTG